MNLETFKTLRCPSCGQDSGKLKVEERLLKVEERLNQPVKVTCGECGDYGSPAYFTPATPQVERIISRQIDVDAGRDDRAHVKAMTAAMDLFVQAAGEEGLDIRWETFRVAAARGEDGTGITFVAVVKAWERRHARDAADLKLITPAEAMYEMGFAQPQASQSVETSGWGKITHEQRGDVVAPSLFKPKPKSPFNITIDSVS